jgi:hypothetical protein
VFAQALALSVFAQQVPGIVTIRHGKVSVSVLTQREEKIARTVTDVRIANNWRFSCMAFSEDKKRPIENLARG